MLDKCIVLRIWMSLVQGKSPPMQVKEPYGNLDMVTCKLSSRSKIRPKDGFFCYAPFLGLFFWVTFCSNSNTLTFDSKVYMLASFQLDPSSQFDPHGESKY